MQGVVKQILELAEVRSLSFPGSGRGLTNEMTVKLDKNGRPAEPPTGTPKQVLVFVEDEIDGFLRAASGSRADPNKLMVVRDIMAAFTEAFGKVGVRAKADEPAQDIRNPVVSWLGGTTPDNFNSAVLTPAMMKSGFISRALVAVSNDHSLDSDMDRKEPEGLPDDLRDVVSTAAEKPATGRRKSLPPRGSGTDAGTGRARLGTRAPRIAGVCQGALA
jgi:hypothetical protein